MNYTIKTFGCKVNTYDTALLQKQMEGLNIKSPGYHIVNTCAVTNTAVMESLRWIRQYKKKHPRIKIVVTGCASQVELNKYLDNQDIDLIVANSHKHQLADILKNDDEKLSGPRVFHSNIFKNTQKGEGGQMESRHTRLFLKIQDGCNQFCTFCVIPFARGKSRSLDTSYLCRHIEKMRSMGAQEVVLTGVHIGDYQDPKTGRGLDYLVEQILKTTKIPRIRLSSLEPVELTPSLLSLYKDERMCPHFHLSIQSASSKILKDMKRKYSQKDVRKCLDQIHRNLPYAFIGMDLIAGFPGESQKDFEETYEFFKDSYWTKMHIFPYSPRPSTYALRRKDHLHRSLIVRRAGLLRNLSRQRLHEQALLQVGRVKYVLPLKKGGLSRDYWPVEWDDSKTNQFLSENADSKHPKKENKHFSHPAIKKEIKALLKSWQNEKNKFKGEVLH